MTESISRKRGAQPGNRNAFKHGFYSSQFKTAERRLLTAMSPTDLSAEVQLMRIVTLRFMQAQASLPSDPDFETHMSILRAIALSIEAINRLVRAQYILAKSPQLADQAWVDEAIASLEALDPYLDDED